MRILTVLMIAIFVPTSAYANEQFDFVSAIISSFQYAIEAQQRIDITSTDKSIPEVNTMTDIIYAKHKMEAAKSKVDPFENSNNEYIREVVSGYILGYKVVIDVYDTRLNILERLYNTNLDEYAKLGTVAREFAEQNAKVEEGWEILSTSTVAIKYILLNPNIVEDGLITNLYITCAQRQTLINTLESLCVKSDTHAGKSPIEFSASLLLKFLQGDWKSADSKIKGK